MTVLKDDTSYTVTQLGAQLSTDSEKGTYNATTGKLEWEKMGDWTPTTTAGIVPTHDSAKIELLSDARLKASSLEYDYVHQIVPDINQPESIA